MEEEAHDILQGTVPGTLRCRVFIFSRLQLGVGKLSKARNEHSSSNGRMGKRTCSARESSRDER